MLYIFLLHSDPDLAVPVNVMEQHGAVEALARGRDAFIMSEALGGPATARTVRLREGRTLVSDGPFAETKEALGGLYILDCADLDQALEYAAKIPDAQFGSVEVRPLVCDSDWTFDVAPDRERMPVRLVDGRLQPARG